MELRNQEDARALIMQLLDMEARLRYEEYSSLKKGIRRWILSDPAVSFSVFKLFNAHGIEL